MTRATSRTTRIPGLQSAQIFESLARWGRKHQFGIGAAACAAGAAIFALSSADLTTNLRRHAITTIMPKCFGALGASAGAVAKLLGSAGIAIAGTAFGVPALVIAGGSSLIFGVLGWTAGELLAQMFEPSLLAWIADLGGIAVGAFLMAWGVDQMARSGVITALGRALMRRIRGAALAASDFVSLHLVGVFRDERGRVVGI